MQTPKLEGLVRVAKQAIESLKERKDAAERSSEPPAKRPLLPKGLSTFAQKGKCSVSKSATTSATTSEGAETSMPKTESQQVVETPKTTKVVESPHTAQRLPVGEKKAMSQVDMDLAISTEASETETENYKDVTVTTVHETYSDVEPSSPERVDIQEQREPEVKMKPVMVPEILADFTESIVITDEDEPKLMMDMPIVSHVIKRLRRLIRRKLIAGKVSMLCSTIPACFTPLWNVQHLSDNVAKIRHVHALRYINYLRKKLLSSLDIGTYRWNIRMWCEKTIESDYIDIYIKLCTVTHEYTYRLLRKFQRGNYSTKTSSACIYSIHASSTNTGKNYYFSSIC